MMTSNSPDNCASESAASRIVVFSFNVGIIIEINMMVGESGVRRHNSNGVFRQGSQTLDSLSSDSPTLPTLSQSTHQKLQLNRFSESNQVRWGLNPVSFARAP